MHPYLGISRTQQQHNIEKSRSKSGLETWGMKNARATWTWLWTWRKLSASWWIMKTKLGSSGKSSKGSWPLSNLSSIVGFSDCCYYLATSRTRTSMWFLLPPSALSAAPLHSHIKGQQTWVPAWDISKEHKGVWLLLLI